MRSLQENRIDFVHICGKCAQYLPTCAILDMPPAIAHTKAGSRHRPLADENPW